MSNLVVIDATLRRKAHTRARIIAAAREVLLKEGAGASIETIAARAGVARASVFNQFGNKDRLVEAVIEETFRRLLGGMARVPANLPLREALLRYSRNYVRMALDADAIGLSRLAMFHREQFPRLGNVAYQIGFSMTVPVLATYLKEQMSRGRIRRTNPLWAAERLFASVIGHSRHRILYGVGHDRPSRVDAFLVESVDLFLESMAATGVRGQRGKRIGGGASL